MLALQVFLAGVEALGHHTLLGTYLGHGAPALALDEYLAFLTFVRPYLTTEIIVGPQIPLAVPAMALHGLCHLVDRLLHAGGLVGERW